MINPIHLNSQPDFVSKTSKDPFLLPVTTLKGIKNLSHLSLFLRNPDKIAFRCPLFVLGSVKDYICNFRRLSENFPRWSSPEKRLYVFEEGGHEILIGPQKMESAAVIAEWITEKLKMAPPFGTLIRLPQQSQYEI